MPRHDDIEELRYMSIAHHLRAITLPIGATEHDFANEVARVASTRLNALTYWGDGKTGLQPPCVGITGKWKYCKKEHDSAWSLAGNAAHPDEISELKVVLRSSNSQVMYRHLNDVLRIGLAAQYDGLPNALHVAIAAVETAAIGNGPRNDDWGVLAAHGNQRLTLRLLPAPNLPPRHANNAWLGSAGTPLISPACDSALTWILSGQSSAAFGWWYRLGVLDIVFDQVVHQHGNWHFLVQSPVDVLLNGQPALQRDVLQWLP